MFACLTENVSICLVIVVSTLLMCGVWKMIKDPLPGDQEKQVLIRQMREISVRSQRHTRAILAEIAGWTEQNRRADHKEESKRNKKIGSQGTTGYAGPRQQWGTVSKRKG